MDKRLAFIGITVKDRKKNAPLVNQLLSAYGDDMIGRMGIPLRNKNCYVITVVVEITTDDLGALTGKLGKISGVQVQSAVMK